MDNIFQKDDNNDLKISGHVSIDDQPIEVAGIKEITDPVDESEHNNTSRNKINYSVPASKQLWVTSCYTTNVEGKMFIEFQDDGTPFWSAGLNEAGSTYNQISLDPQAPFGPFAAGSTIRARREDGDSGKEWSAGFTGYLEDV